MARDYAAEYARRVARERDRATVEGRPFDPGRARGHADKADELTRSAIQRIATRNAHLLGLDPEEYREIIAGAIQTQGDDAAAREGVLVFLKGQRASIADPSGVGRDLFNNRPIWLPIELFYYHAGEGAA
jgi:hypothetical protein